MSDIDDAVIWVSEVWQSKEHPVEGGWSHVKRSPANLAVGNLKRLEALVRNRLKSLQYRPRILDSFIDGTGLALKRP